MADGKVTIDTSLDNSGFEKGVKNIDKSFSGLKSSLSGIGKLIAGAFAVGQVISFGKACIELGSNVAEVQNVVVTAFCEMSSVVEDFAKSSIQNYGMSTLAAKKTASNYMAMARGMGVAMDEASDMSIALTGLSADVASFYNTTQEEAAYKLQSVFTGETETLKELGVVMTQVNLQNYAMQHGMNSNIQSRWLCAMPMSQMPWPLRLGTLSEPRTAGQTRPVSYPCSGRSLCPSSARH